MRRPDRRQLELFGGPAPAVKRRPAVSEADRKRMAKEDRMRAIKAMARSWVGVSFKG